LGFFLQLYLIFSIIILNKEENMSVKTHIKNNSLLEVLNNIKSTQLFWIITFSALTFLSAQVVVPVQPVPFTLQTMLVLLSGAFLGSKNGAASQVLYLIAGSIGLPVFAGFGFGFMSLFGPTGGYLLSFPFAAFLVGYLIEKRNNLFTIIFSFVVGATLILLAGASYLSLFFNGDFSKALFSGAIIFSVWDLLKVAAAVSIYKGFAKKYPKLPA
jgi:biotin transport system substrate-specific component